MASPYWDNTSARTRNGVEELWAWMMWFFVIISIHVIQKHPVHAAEGFCERSSRIVIFVFQCFYNVSSFS